MRAEHPSPPRPGGGQTAFERIDGLVSAGLSAGMSRRDRNEIVVWFDDEGSGAFLGFR